MASIPLPALNIRAPEQPNLLQQISQIQSLKGMMGQQQLQQQNIQAGQLENQQRSMDLESQKALMKGFQEANGDPDKAVSLAQKYGAKPADILKLKMAGIEQQKQAIELVSQKGALALQQADAMKGAHDAVAAAPAEAKQQVYSQQLQGLQKMGVDVSQMPPQYPGDEQFKYIGAALQGHKQQVEDAAKQAGILKDNAQASAANAEATKTNKVVAGMNPQGITAEQQAQLVFEQRKTASQEAAQRETARHNQATESTIDMTNPQTQVNVAAVAQGRMKIQDVLTPRVPLPQRQAFLAAVQAANPNFNSADYDIQKGVAKSFTSGAYSQQLNAINTARNHMQTFTDLADALDNGNVQALNKAGNAINTQFGSDKATNFNIAKQAFSGEVGKAFAGANVAEGDRTQLQEQISAASSPAQLKGVAKVADFLLEGKQRALQQTYDQGRQSKPNFGAQADQPSPQQAAPSAATVKMMAPNGQVSDVPADQVSHYESMGAKRMKKQ